MPLLQPRLLPRETAQKCRPIGLSCVGALIFIFVFCIRGGDVAAAAVIQHPQKSSFPRDAVVVPVLDHSDCAQFNLAEHIADFPWALTGNSKGVPFAAFEIEGSQGFGVGIYTWDFPAVLGADSSASQITADSEYRGRGVSNVDDNNVGPSSLKTFVPRLDEPNNDFGSVGGGKLFAGEIDAAQCDVSQPPSRDSQQQCVNADRVLGAPAEQRGKWFYYLIYPVLFGAGFGAAWLTARR